MRLSYFLFLTLTWGSFFASGDYALPSECSRTFLGRLNYGVIMSYNYPFDYRDNLTCTYRIYVDLLPNRTKTICFTFFRFSLEASSPFCSFDYLSIGLQSSIKYCGTGIWQFGLEDRRNPFSSIWSNNFCWPVSGTTFDLTFSSDNIVRSSGFFVKFNIYDSAENTRPSPKFQEQTEMNWTSCQRDEWMCFCHRCIPQNLLCDGKDDCGDGSDETYAHARCSTGQNIEACDFSIIGSERSICEFSLDGWLLSSGLEYSGSKLNDHTNGSGGYFLYTNRNESHASSLPVKLNASTTYCLRFWYYIVGSVLPLVVYITTEEAYGQPEWNRGSGAGRWMMGEIYISSRSSAQVVFSTDGRGQGRGLVALDDISILEGNCSGVDISCNFESGLCGWNSLEHLDHRGGRLLANEQWTREHQGSSAGNNSSVNGNGSYMFVKLQVTDDVNERKAIFQSPPISAAILQPKCLHFLYIIQYAADLSCWLSVAFLQYDNSLTAEVWNQSIGGTETWIQTKIDFEADGPFQIVISAAKRSKGICQVFLDQVQLQDDHCYSRDSCSAGEFRCGDGRCISQTLVCDKSLNCNDGSDEALSAGCRDMTTEPSSLPMDSVSRPCQNSSSTFVCRNGLNCIPRNLVCDGKSECSDSSDELPSYGCSETTTTSPLSVLSALFPSTPAVCGFDQFHCSDGLCLDIGKQCNGKNDCFDGLDEKNCASTVHHSFLTTTSSAMVSCPDKRLVCLPEQRCLVSGQLCDGHRDCSDGSDEIHCPVVMLLNSGAIVAIVLGSILGFLIVLSSAILAQRFRKRSKAPVQDQMSADVSTIFATSSSDHLSECTIEVPSYQRSKLPLQQIDSVITQAKDGHGCVDGTRSFPAAFSSDRGFPPHTDWLYRQQRLRTTLPNILSENRRTNLSGNGFDRVETGPRLSRSRYIYRSLPPIPATAQSMPPLLEALLEHLRRRQSTQLSNSHPGEGHNLNLTSEHIYEEPIFATTSAESRNFSSAMSPVAEHPTQFLPFHLADSTSDFLVIQPHLFAPSNYDPKGVNTCIAAGSSIWPPVQQMSHIDEVFPHNTISDYQLHHSPESCLVPFFHSGIPEVPDVPVSNCSDDYGCWGQIDQGHFPSSLRCSRNLPETVTQRLAKEHSPLPLRESDWDALADFHSRMNSELSGNHSTSPLVQGSAQLNLDSLPNGTSV